MDFLASFLHARINSQARFLLSCKFFSALSLFSAALFCLAVLMAPPEPEHRVEARSLSHTVFLILKLIDVVRVVGATGRGIGIGRSPGLSCHASHRLCPAVLLLPLHSITAPAAYNPLSSCFHRLNPLLIYDSLHPSPAVRAAGGKDGVPGSQATIVSARWTMFVTRGLDQGLRGT